MLELVSVHIPKTGGSSLGATLNRKYGRRLCLVFPPLKFPLRSRLVGEVRRIGRHVKSFPAVCVHGHFPASRYANAKANMITFVRDPVERRVSTWNYVRREHDRLGVIANSEWKKALDMDLAEFVALPNRTLAQFLDVPMTRFSFVGSMADFDADVARLCAWLSVEYVQEKLNAAPERSTASADFRAAFERANPQEIEIFERAMARRKEAG